MLDSAHQGLVVAVYEAELPAGQCAALRQAYAAALDRGIPSGIIQTFLVPGPAEGTPWRLVVVWAAAERLRRIEKRMPCRAWRPSARLAASRASR